LRLPYQLQLSPIFGWGFFMAGGRLHETNEVWRFAVAFLCFHVGCFGGLTALNSFYDRDQTPIGGLWKPPAPPRYLWHFAWAIQLLGVIPLLLLDGKLVLIYSAIIVLALGYSHPRTRWKSKPLSSLVIVALGQGVLDFGAGAFITGDSLNDQAALIGCLGATTLVCAWYPLTQLFQTREDALRGDHTVAKRLLDSGGRALVFTWAQEYCALGMSFNILALLAKNLWADALLFLFAGLAALLYLRHWHRKGQATPEDDFHRVHWLLRFNALAFAVYLLARLIF
jgi:1,4-dihydroxy-2-naphthoate octaprenyltransferase